MSPYVVGPSDIMCLREYANAQNEHIAKYVESIKRIDEEGGSATERSLCVSLRDQAIADFHWAINLLARLL
jgi:hypothetical protein